MKNTRSWILLGGILLIGAVFLLLDFRVAASNTQTGKLIFTTDMGENMPVHMQRRDKISIVLVGEGPLVRALQKALPEQIGKAGIGESDVVQELESVYQHPVLVVKVSEPDPIWTPFFAISHFSVTAGYATNGDPTFMGRLDKTQPYIRNPDPSVINLYTEYEVSDRSLGLISRLGYHQYLADYLAQEIVQTLKNLYNIQSLTGQNLHISGLLF